MRWLQKGKLTMDKNQISRGAHAGALPSNRRTQWARLSLIALFLALSVWGLQPKTPAQALGQGTRGGKASLLTHQSRDRGDCSACEPALVSCLANGGGAACYAQYDLCFQNCQ